MLWTAAAVYSVVASGEWYKRSVWIEVQPQPSGSEGHGSLRRKLNAATLYRASGCPRVQHRT